MVLKEVYLGWLLEGGKSKCTEPEIAAWMCRADIIMHYDRGLSAQRATYHSSFLPPSITDWARNAGDYFFILTALRLRSATALLPQSFPP